jgi:dipeptidyl aminopeptidase/acylaminoacyl peptidase
MRVATLVSAVALALFSTSTQAKPFDIETLVDLRRLSDPQVSPDGKAVLFGLRETDRAANKGISPLYLMPLDQSAPMRRLTASGQSASQGRFAPDGKSIYFLSARSGSMQVWQLPLDGGEALQVSKVDADVSSFELSPSGKQIAFTAEVFADCGADFACTKKRLDERSARQDSGVLYEQLFIRHWDTWADGRRAQLFLADLGAPFSQARLLSANIDGDVPSKPDGDESEYSFAADGESLFFSVRIAGKGEPWSTNFDLYQVTTQGEAAPRNLTAANAAWDTSPTPSSNGKFLYYKAMARPGFEADRYRIMERNLATGAEREVAPDWDRSPDGLAISADGKTLLVNALDVGHRALWAIDVKSGKTKALDRAGSVSAFAQASKRVVYLRDDLDSPADLYSVSIQGGEPERLSEVNADKLKGIEFGAFEQFSFAGYGGHTVYAHVVKPAGFETGKQYPIAFIVHGGPQSSFGNGWSYRWNPQTYAGQGYAVVFVDFHGSTGYGQAFTDSISGDWGGKPLEDLKKGLAAARSKYNFLSSDKACALGASYGGFMVNWIAGAWSDGFTCLVNHAGILDNRFMSLSTEELWFTEWENGGLVWEKPENYERHNPISLLKNWRTPMLVTHGMLDFRVPFEQGIAAFTALQRKGIESKFLHFPDENHWILKPANSVLWHRTVEAWLKQHLK